MGFQQSLRRAQRTGCDMLAITTGNYVVAVLALLALLLWNGLSVAELGAKIRGLPPALWLLGVINGLLFFWHLLVLYRAYQAAGVGITTAATQSAVVIPPLVAFVLYGEAISMAAWIALLLVVPVMILIRPLDPRSTPMKPAEDAALPTAPLPVPAPWLLATFLMAGAIYSLHKVAVKIEPNASERSIYLVMVFAIATIAAAIALVKRKRAHPAVTARTASSAREKANEESHEKALKTNVFRHFNGLAWSVPVGLCNGLGVFCLLGALEQLPTASVYPTSGPAQIVLNTLIGLAFWGERPASRQWLGMAIAVGVILLVTLG